MTETRKLRVFLCHFLAGQTRCLRPAARQRLDTVPQGDDNGWLDE